MGKHLGILALMGVAVALIYLHASGRLALGETVRHDLTDSPTPPPLSGPLPPADIARMAQESGASLLEPFAWRDALGRTYTVNPTMGQITAGG